MLSLRNILLLILQLDNDFLAWRKRGVATALLCATMHAFKAEGLQEALLGVDTQNLSGALRVYERVGFKPIKRFMQYEKAVE